MDAHQYRKNIYKKIEEYEKQGLWDVDVEDDPETIELLPGKADYLNKKLSSKIGTFIANKVATRFYEKMIKKKQFIIKEIRGIENFLKVKGGAIITSNHFNPCENYAIWKAIKPHMGKKPLYRVIREGNFTNPPKPFGFIMRHCNTLPLSSNIDTMKEFMKAFSVLIKRGEKILIYPEQAMWWNYKKPRPLKPGAFRFAVKNKAPIIPCFVTMEDSDVMGGDGYPVQAYTVHILEPIYPNKDLDDKGNIEEMKNKNFEMWKEVYEKFYGMPLIYNTKERK